MATRKRVKKNIKEDQLVTYAVRVSRWSQEHFNQVIIGVVVLVGLIAVLVFTANSRQSAARQGERQMATALALLQQGDYESAKVSFQQIYERYGGKQGTASRYFKAECELRQGNFAQALTEYESYLNEAGDFPAFEHSAAYGKAMCYEGMEDYLKAAETMESLVGTLSEDDPRFVDSAYQAGEFFALAGNDAKAAEYFQLVYDKGSGDLKERASVAIRLMKRE